MKRVALAVLLGMALAALIAALVNLLPGPAEEPDRIEWSPERQR